MWRLCDLISAEDIVLILMQSFSYVMDSVMEKIHILCPYSDLLK